MLSQFRGRRGYLLAASTLNAPDESLCPSLVFHHMKIQCTSRTLDHAAAKVALETFVVNAAFVIVYMVSSLTRIRAAQHVACEDLLCVYSVAFFVLLQFTHG